jgi:hypothetical protein
MYGLLTCGISQNLVDSCLDCMVCEVTLPTCIYLANQSQPSPGVDLRCHAKWVVHPRASQVGFCAFFASSRDSTLLSHLFHIIVNRYRITKIESIRIGNTTLKFIPVTFVRIRACKIWWIIRLTYFILLIIITETSANWNRSQVTNWRKATNSLNWTQKQETVSYSIPEQQSTQVTFVIQCVPRELKYCRKSLKYLQYVHCVLPWCSTYLITWSHWEISAASVCKKW